MKTILPAFLFSMLWLNNFSQPFSEKYINVEAIGINKGLSQGMINSIAQDHYGFMWFGTLDGLNRYDGYKFQVFRNDPLDNKSISGNFITSIFEDSKKRLWIGTALNGLNLFIEEQEQFIRYNTGTVPSLSNNSIISIQEDKNGAIWIGTQSGLNKLIITDNRIEVSRPIEKKMGDTSLSVSIKKIPLTDPTGKELFIAVSAEPCFLISKTGTIWVSASGTIIKILPSKTNTDTISNDTKFIFRQKDGERYEDITKIMEDTAKNLLCFMGRKYFTWYTPGSTGASYWNCAPFDLNASANQVIWDKGMLWERTPAGLFTFNLAGKKAFRIRSDISENDKFLETPFSIYKDRSGIIWIGTAGFGLLKYNPRTEAFHNIKTKAVYWMHATPQGNVLAVCNDIKYFIKDTSGSYPSFNADRGFNARLKLLSKENADIAVQDNEGIFWINIKGAARIDLKANSIRLIKNKTVLFPYYLDHKDRLWYATSDSLCLYDKTSERVTAYRFPANGLKGSPYKFCEAICQDKNNIFWIGTTEGLLSFDESKLQWRQYKTNPADSNSISSNIVFSVCDDAEAPGDYIWAGTNGGGLNRLNVRSGTFEQIGIKKGLPNMVIYGILTDKAKNIWVSTNNGIACLKLSYVNDVSEKSRRIKQMKFMYYYEENGLQSNEFNRYAYCKAKDGTLFFGGVNGLNYFDPQQVSVNDFIPNIVITDFKIGNRVVPFRTRDSSVKQAAEQVLSRPVFLTEAIELPYSANMISFEFASLDFTLSEKNLYQYKLDDFDKEWVQSGNVHSATYTNLDPGTYTFRVKGSNSDGTWNEHGADIQLTILAPWHMTWWFRMLVFTVTISLLILFFRYRLQQKLKLHTMRNHIASDLHDEIGSTLSSVYIYSEVAQKEGNISSPQTTGYLKQISADAGIMIEALGDIVWTVNSKNDRFENIINRMRATAVELFEAKAYELHLEFDDQLSLLKLGMDQRKNFYLIFKEAINNVAKYADGKNVWITLSYKKPMIVLSVKDDGRGFIFNNKTPGNGLGNMQRRAAHLKGKFEILSLPGAGTLIKLTFSV